jgi:hypothetical protein
MIRWGFVVGLCGLVVAAATGCGPDSRSCAGEGVMSCGGACVSIDTHPDHCGTCGNACDEGMGCVDGACIVAEPECEPGETGTCYDGPGGSNGVGICHGGMRTCTESSLWGDCEDQQVPIAEDCTNGMDENCNGEIDEDRDLDGDGFATCEGDCCDASNEGCDQPELVNPGAFEVDGNELDDDCDTLVDNVADTTCDDGLASDSSNGMHYARAIDLCQTATDEDRRWGVISARLRLADGSGTPAVESRSIRTDFGGADVQFGEAMAVLSTGRAADRTDTAPNYFAFQPGRATGTASDAPDDWLIANGGAFPNAPGCPESADTAANDPVMLELTIRVPSNAASFSMGANFFSSEYPEWVCSPFNDMFVVLLDSLWDGDPANPADKNLAIYESPGGDLYPVGVNLAFGDTGLFRQCENGDTGCAGLAVDGTTQSCDAINELIGSGFDVKKPSSANGPGTPGWCGDNDLTGGGTGWLETRGNVVGGEVITLRIAIWDSTDQAYDSVVLLDNFQWSVQASEPGTSID